VQWRLNALGLGAGPVDGNMGPRTGAAVVRFQREQTKGGTPLAIDGIPGPLTQKRLVEVLGY
jgi:peptidoglycan hydrolase-like protein with peptidoglycan-binding domain